MDDHNLNRQILYGKQHVGKSKVESSLSSLQVCGDDKFGYFMRIYGIILME